MKKDWGLKVHFQIVSCSEKDVQDVIEQFLDSTQVYQTSGEKWRPVWTLKFKQELGQVDTLEEGLQACKWMNTVGFVSRYAKSEYPSNSLHTHRETLE